MAKATPKTPAVQFGAQNAKALARGKKALVKAPVDAPVKRADPEERRGYRPAEAYRPSVRHTWSISKMTDGATLLTLYFGNDLVRFWIFEKWNEARDQMQEAAHAGGRADQIIVGHVFTSIVKEEHDECLKIAVPPESPDEK